MPFMQLKTNVAVTEQQETFAREMQRWFLWTTVQQKWATK